MTIDKQALRQKAVKAGGEEWQSRKMPGPAGEYTIIVKGSLEKHPGWTTCRPVADEVIDKKTMDFIAAANPATMLALLDELDSTNGYASAYEAEKWHYHGLAESEGERADRAEKRVAELESIATDYGVKFQKAQDALKHQELLHKSQMEAAEKRIAELKNDEVRQRLANAEHQLHMAELEAALGELKKISEQPAVSTHYARVLRRHIAELEARTVTPPKNNVANVGDSRWMWYQRDLMWIDAIRAAGIKVKGE